MADERRKLPRLKSRLNLSYVIEGTDQKGSALATDVSGGGVRFLSEHPLALGHRVELVLQLPDRAQPIQCEGEVVWSRPSVSHGAGCDVGVRFIKIQEQDQRWVAQYARLYAGSPEQPAG